MRAPWRVTGFTLVEMLVVLALLSLLASVAVPAVGRILVPEEGSSDDALIRNASREAVATGRPVRVELSHGPVLLLPDGRAAGGAVDARTARPRRAP